MTNFDAVDFSERRLEEVISFFWRSVYIYIVFEEVLGHYHPLGKYGINYCHTLSYPLP